MLDMDDSTILDEAMIMATARSRHTTLSDGFGLDSSLIRDETLDLTSKKVLESNGVWTIWGKVQTGLTCTLERTDICDETTTRT